MFRWSRKTHAKPYQASLPRLFRSCITAITRTMTTGPRPSVARKCLPSLAYTDDFFKFTRGRFVCDEATEVSQRYIRFNVNELGRLAAEAVGANTCVSIEKYPDGMFNKAMLLTMDDGTQVVAKIPNPNAGRPHFTTASEVATMEFTRNVLGTPVPKVYAWSSRAHENPVGAEYIIMEKITGIELEQVWSSMKIGDRFAVVKTIARFQKAWMSASFKKFGSLYYAKDLGLEAGNDPLYTDENGTEITDFRFAVGPSTSRETIDNGRATIEFDRGPWATLEDYHAAIGHREAASTKQLPRLPKSPLTLCGPGTYQPTRDKKLKAIECYQELIKFLLPNDRSIASSCLWHSDLHVANIFVNPSKPTEVMGIIDWQSTELAPLYFQARQPHFIDYDGPDVEGLERPALPKDLERLEPEAKRAAETLYLQQSLCVLFQTLVHRQNHRLYAALEYQRTPSYLLLLLARNLLIDGEASYLSQVAELKEVWDTLPGAQGAPYPFSFSAEEKARMEADLEGVERGMDLMRAIRESLGELFPEQGIVKTEFYKEALDALGQMREQVIEEYARDEREAEVWRTEWPFGN